MRRSGWVSLALIKRIGRFLHPLIPYLDNKQILAPFDTKDICNKICTSVMIAS